jgi:hypothetical protein
MKSFVIEDTNVIGRGDDDIDGDDNVDDDGDDGDTRMLLLTGGNAEKPDDTVT